MVAALPKILAIEFTHCFRGQKTLRRFFQTVDFAHARKGATHVGNGNGTTDDERNIECLNDLLVLPTLFGAADQVIGDAIVAAKNSASDQAEQFLCFGAKRAGLVSLMIEREEAFDPEVAAAEDFVR